MRITLKQLVVFEAVARLGSVSRAAEEVALSQSAASMSLGDLESHLQAELFHRQGKKLVLNDYGRWLQPKVHQVLLQAEEIEKSAGQVEAQGTLKVAASSTIGNYLVPRLIADYVQQHANVQVDLKVGNTEQVVNDMLSLKIDLGLIEGLCHSHELLVRPWKTDVLKVFCGKSHPLAQKKSLSIADLSKEAWVLREPGSGTREIFSLAVKGKIDALQVKLELGNSEAIKTAVKTGLGLGCLSELAISDEVAHGELVCLPVKGIDLRREFFVISRQNSFQSALLHSFDTWLFDSVQQN